MAPTRRFAMVLLLAGGVACAQTSLPATSPTALPAAGAATLPPASPAVPPAARAEVKFADGKLAITADNSSLNQILREISRQTGMKITGGVADERVFGKYGPGPAAEILANLLAGTGSNMLLRETAAKTPAELILTARQGGPTPPNPNAPGFDDESDHAEEQPAAQTENPPVPPPQALPGVPGGIRGAMALNPPPGANPSTAPGTNPTSPNGVQTPQQIFEQLQQLQQQQPAKPQ